MFCWASCACGNTWVPVHVAMLRCPLQMEPSRVPVPLCRSQRTFTCCMFVVGVSAISSRTRQALDGRRWSSLRAMNLRLLVEATATVRQSAVSTGGTGPQVSMSSPAERTARSSVRLVCTRQVPDRWQKKGENDALPQFITTYY